MKKSIHIVAIAVVPGIAKAQQLEGFENLVIGIGNIVDRLIPIVFAAGLLFFFWGLAKYIINAGNDEKKAEGKNVMIMGIIALFLMASVLGVIDFIGKGLGIEQGGEVTAPGVEFTR